jgi:SAM-dependent methyltransferase
MNTHAIQRQYDEVIAPHYDLDPQAVTGASLDRAAEQLRCQHVLEDGPTALRALDVGIGTGQFLLRVKTACRRLVQPFGLDLSEKMIDVARRRLPELVAEVGNAEHIDPHFPDQSFDLICTHFITGFVPMRVLAPQIRARLEDGGYWSFVGGSKAGFPVLQAKAATPALRWLFGGRGPAVDDLVCNPAGRDEVEQTLKQHGFAVRQCETFEPKIRFRNFDEFMDFAYRGGWLTPFVEALGLHKAGAATRLFLNALVFPVEDHHSIEIVLAQKVGD